jgi:hypothetical protein
MAQPPPARPRAEEIEEQLAKTVADLQTLGEQLGVTPRSSPRVISLQRARVTFLIVVALAALIGWLLWEHWHSLPVATAPLIWIIGHSLRWRRNTLPPDRQPPG